jgi:hypothetical protein
VRTARGSVGAAGGGTARAAQAEIITIGNTAKPTRVMTLTRGKYLAKPDQVTSSAPDLE